MAAGSGLVLSDAGLSDRQVVLRNGIFQRYFVRLFQNDHTPQRADTVGSYVEATFNGYPGPVQISNWSQPVVTNHISTISASPINYAKAAGPIGNFIFGYYVTNAAGALMWAERRTGPGLPMFSVGDVYQVQPVQSDTSDLPI